MSQLAQIAGAIAILVAFAAAQLGLVSVQSRLYLILNLAGSAVLALDAWHERQWGFLLLEGMWALVSGWSLSRSQAGESTG
jgi:membrane-bound ClpP family serine protease